jgi:hypothetical protein
MDPMLLAAVLLLAANVHISAKDESITIRVINGKTGKPIPHARLIVFQGRSSEDVRLQKNVVDAETDGNGVASVVVPPSLTRIQVWVDWNHLCQKSPNLNSYGVIDIQTNGANTPNDCGAIKREAVPGELVVFARPQSFWERMRH